MAIVSVRLIHIYHPLKDFWYRSANLVKVITFAFILFIASYVSAMVPVKSPKEYYVQQEVIVLFCETVER